MQSGNILGQGKLIQKGGYSHPVSLERDANLFYGKKISQPYACFAGVGLKKVGINEMNYLSGDAIYRAMNILQITPFGIEQRLRVGKGNITFVSIAPTYNYVFKHKIFSINDSSKAAYKGFSFSLVGRGGYRTHFYRKYYIDIGLLLSTDFFSKYAEAKSDNYKMEFASIFVSFSRTLKREK